MQKREFPETPSRRGWKCTKFLRHHWFVTILLLQVSVVCVPGVTYLSQRRLLRFFSISGTVSLVTMAAGFDDGAGCEASSIPRITCSSWILVAFFLRTRTELRETDDDGFIESFQETIGGAENSTFFSRIKRTNKLTDISQQCQWRCVMMHSSLPSSSLLSHSLTFLSVQVFNAHNNGCCVYMNEGRRPENALTQPTLNSSRGELKVGS